MKVNKNNSEMSLSYCTKNAHHLEAATEAFLHEQLITMYTLDCLLLQCQWNINSSINQYQPKETLSVLTKIGPENFLY